MGSVQSTREDPRTTTKAALKQHAKELRVLASGLGHDRKLQDKVERAAEWCEDARDSIKLSRAKRKRERTPAAEKSSDEECDTVGCTYQEPCGNCR